jgi:hypothetical protein
MPPKKGGSSVGVILGAGCALLMVLVAVVAVGLYVVLRPGAGSSAAGPPPRTQGGTSSVTAKDLRDFSGSRGQVLFVAELVNGGTTSVTPSARVRLFDARRTEVASLPCNVAVRQLGPGEKAPCTFSYSGARSSFTSSEVVVDSSPASARQALLTVTGAVLSRAGIGHQVAGTVTNPASVAMRSGNVLVTLYGADGRIVGAGSFDLSRGLAAGAKAPFIVNVVDVASPPKTFAARAVASPD